jgi:hypothetical protein
LSDQGEPEQKQALHLFRNGPDYRTYHSSGVWGGPTPGGEVSLNFYTEQMLVPEVVCSTLAPGGQLEEQYRSPGGDPGQVLIERQVQCTIMMSPLQAVQLQEWLSRQIQQLREVGVLKPPGDPEILP